MSSFAPSRPLDNEESLPLVGRFAPSPTGRMHAGNIFSSLVAWIVAKRSGGRIILRIEDLDPDRSKPAFADQIMRDYESLGLTWDEGPYYQSKRTELYRAAYETLTELSNIYPCFCTRADILAASAPHSESGVVYARTCLGLAPQEREALQAGGRRPAWRIQVEDKDISFTDHFQGYHSFNIARQCGDFIVRRSDGTFSYQLAVVVDDADMGVTSVVRGADLLSSTAQQIYLAAMLGFELPQYAHIPLLVDSSGRRIAKRDRDASLDEMLAVYGSPEGVLGHIASVAGLVEVDEPLTASALLECADLDALRRVSAITWR